ncbi:hypothetical protein D3C87_2207770 [compost metagenome]
MQNVLKQYDLVLKPAPVKAPRKAVKKSAEQVIVENVEAFNKAVLKEGNIVDSTHLK